MQGKIDILIAKSLSGNAEEGEKQQLDDWINSSPANKAYYDSAVKIWNSSERARMKDTPVDLDSAWNDLLKRTEQPVRRTTAWPSPLKIAAGLALVACLSVLLLLFTGKPDSPQLVAINVPDTSVKVEQEEGMTVAVHDSVIETADSVPVIPQPQKKRRNKQINNVVMITVTTGDSARAFMLPDNSIVYLNDHSTLVYPENLGKNNRKLSLDGEAYFEVRRDTMQFIVACRNTVTRGTDGAFNVKWDGKKEQVEIIVVTGSAVFSGVGKKEYKKLTVNAGERGVYDNKEQISKTKNERKDYKWWQKKGLKATLKRLLNKIRNSFK